MGLNFYEGSEVKMIEITLANYEDVDTIVQILNKVTLYLHNKGINQWVFPWTKDMIENDVKEGLVYLLKVDGSPIGTFSIKDTNDINIDIVYPNNKYLYRVAILREYQGKGLGAEMVRFALDYSRKLNKSLYLDCWAGNSKLKSFYKSLGFDLLEEVPEEDYFISVFKAI